MPVRFQLRELLEELGITQTELFRVAGVSLTTINRIVQNHTGQVSLETLDRLSSALGVLSGKRIEPGDLIVRDDGGASSGGRTRRQSGRRSG